MALRAPDLRTGLVLCAAALAAAGLYFVAGAGVLQFGLDRFMFPPGKAAGVPAAPPAALRIAGEDGAQMQVRRVGGDQASVGCIVWFPGQEDDAQEEARTLVPDLQKAGLAVYTVGYPGQGGSPGRPRLDEVERLAEKAVAAVVATCGRTRTVVVGQALGGMVAAYAAGGTRPAGLVLESTSPSLSAGVRATLRGRWFLRPLAALPVQRLVPRDFTLAETLPAALHVVIFQGAADTQAPIAELWPDDAQPAHPPIVTVPGGTRADTLARAKPALIATVLGMIRGSQDEAASGEDED